MSRVVVVRICCCLLLLSAGLRADETMTPEQLALFEKHVRPVLAEHCFECHNEDYAESDLDLTSRAGMLRGGQLGPAIVPGKPTESLLLSAVRHDEFIKMPPKEKLSIAVIAQLTRWVEQGAPWPGADNSKSMQVQRSDSGPVWTEEQKQHWAFQPMKRPQPPQVNSDWPSSPIDSFVYRRLHEAGLRPAPPADRRALIRRATYDLHGLPPTPEETADYLADESPQAFARVVDRLLASPRYGERWGRHWLDVARYADSNGLDENISYANAWHYRDYVIRALNADKPWARFVQEQLAGDLLPEPVDEQQNRDRLVGTGFLALGAKMLAEDDPVKMQMDIIDEQLSTTGQVFMGMTLGCARCHDHKFDPLPAADYYGLAGIFKSSKTMENHKVVAVWYERALVTSQVQQQIENCDRQLAELQQQIDEISAAQRQQLADDSRQQLAAYLLQSAELQALSAADRPPRGLAAKQEAPFPLQTPGTVIEAEAFHRGDIEFQTTGYGEGIGVVLSRGGGFIEIDVQVEQPGVWQLEMRHAAAQARPLKLLVNNVLIEDEVAGQVTGNWNPSGQRWFPAARFQLQAGKNTLRLERVDVFPHVDRLALVPVDALAADVDAPVFLSQLAAGSGLNLQLLEDWRSFLAQVQSGGFKQFPLFRLWQKLVTRQSQSIAAVWKEALAEPSIVKRTPEQIREQLIGEVPDSLVAAAEVLQKLVQQTEQLPEQWLQLPSPLAGPVRVTSFFADQSAQQRLFGLKQLHADLAAERPQPEVAMGVTEAEPEDLRVHLRGSHIALGKTAPRQFPAIFADVDAPPIDRQQSGRLQLANWLTAANHPLTWRVIVNRVWHWRFGQGLVPSVDNFGLLGQAPTHPELLDWLATEFQQSGGSLKQLHRLMMLSRTYQMSTHYDAKAAETDVTNNLLWRFRRRRLTGEEMRDSLLMLGQGLDLKMGGSLLKVPNRKYVTGSGSNLTDEFQNRRRSVYLPVVRSSVYDVLQTFDFPDPAVSAGARQTSTIAPQALMLMNSELAEQQSLALAEQLLTVTESEQRVQRVFELALNRPPTAEEVRTALGFVDQVSQSLAEEEDREQAQKQAWQSYCRVLLSSNEFAYVE